MSNVHVVTRAKGMLAEGLSVQQAADKLGVAKKTLERLFVAELGQTPGAWRAQEIGSRGEGSATPVFFRLAEYAQLEQVAGAAGVSPNEWARNAVQAALKRASKK